MSMEVGPMRKWLIVHLAILWLAWELVAALDHDKSTWPLTSIIVTYVPWWIYFPVTIILGAWLPYHFWVSGHLHLREANVVSLRNVNNLDPDTAPAEPLVTRAAIVAVATAILALIVKLGVPIDEDAKNAILTIIGILAPIVVAWWARRKVYSPATVARLLAAKKAGGGDPRVRDL